MDLFLEPSLSFEKLSSGTTMPEDPNKWPQEILQELFKQVPYMSDFQPQVVMQKVEPEKGYGFGHILVTNQTEAQAGSPMEAQDAAGLREIRIPIIVKDGLLASLDTLITDDAKVMPLTESRLRAAIFRPQAFDVTSKTPGDQSMIGQLYPPYRQNYGFGGGGMAMSAGVAKEGSALEQYLEKNAVSPTLIMPRRDGNFTVLHEDKSHTISREKVLNYIPELSGAHDEEFGKGNWSTSREVNTPVSKLKHVQKHMGIGAAALAPIGAAAMALSPSKKSLVRKALMGAAGGAGLGAIIGTGTGLLTKESKDQLSVENVNQKRRALEVQDARSEGHKYSSVLQAILPTMNDSDVDSFRSSLSDENVKLAWRKNASMSYPILKTILDRPMEKKASVESLVIPSVMQVIREDDGYLVKTANHKMWNPETFHIDRGTALNSLGSKVVLAADTSGAATLMEGEGVEGAEAPDSDMQEMGPITEPGLYKVQDEEGNELVGYVVPSLVDVNGSEVPLSLFSNGSQSAVQTDILGVPVPGSAEGLPTSDTPQGTGSFITVEGDQLRSTIPMTIVSSVTGPEPTEPGVFQVETFDGRQAEVSLQPNIQVVTGTPEGRMLIPAHWQWMPLGQQGSVALASAEPELDKQSEALRKFATVDVVSGGDTFSVRGFAVDKLAHDQREFLDVDGAMFLLAGLGVAPAYGMRKLAQAHGTSAPVEVRIGRSICTSEEQKTAAYKAAMNLSIPSLRQQLFKEAAVLTDPEAVDVILSIGFLNPENIVTFVNYLPELDRAQLKLCELLVATRLGLSSVPEGAVEKSVRALEEVLEGLKSLAFQGPQEYN